MSRDSAISSALVYQPTPRPAHRRRAGGVSYWALAWVCLALVSYASLVPFRFSVLEPVVGVGDALSRFTAWITGLRWDTGPIVERSSLGNSNRVNDWVVNLLLYLPAALFLRLHLAQRKASWLRQVGLAVLAVLAVSWVIECAQGLMFPVRNPTLQDVTANVIGGTVGALAAVRLRAVVFGSIVWCYRRAAGAVHTVGDFLQRQRQKPALMFVVVALNLALVATWYFSTPEVSGPSSARRTNWLPFARDLDRSYDVAALNMGRMFVLYCLVGALLSLQFLSLRQRGLMGLLVLTLAVLAAVREVLFQRNAGIGVDITGPILAVLAGGFILLATTLTVRAVKASCRRKRSETVEFDRRRRSHVYDHP